MTLTRDNWGHTNFLMGFTRGSGREAFNMGGVRCCGMMAHSLRGSGNQENWRELVELFILLVTSIRANFTKTKSMERYL